jgi:methyl-accepting chemotaxis protein
LLAVGLLIVSCAVTIALSTRLRALIARPILELAATARAVSGSKDYSIRASKQSQDELGTLADALNLMMEGIQSRDSELRMALDERVIRWIAWPG